MGEGEGRGGGEREGEGGRRGGGGRGEGGGERAEGKESRGEESERSELQGGSGGERPGARRRRRIFIFEQCMVVCSNQPQAANVPSLHFFY